jgi:chemotaxis signal transduction protein
MVIDEPLVTISPSPKVLQPQAPVAERVAFARLMAYEPGCWVALPTHTTIEVLDSPKMVEVPGAAYYCRALTNWRKQWLPVLDLQALVHAHAQDDAPPPRHLLVVAYQLAAFERLRYGALYLPSFPETLEISDRAQCPMPTDSDLWPSIALSCFEHQGHAVPVLDTGRLFSCYHG